MIVDWLFRPTCIACPAAARAVCDACAATLLELGVACPRCAEPGGDGETACRRCLAQPLPLDRIVSAWRFGGALATAIRHLKRGATRHAHGLAPLWAPLLAAACGDDSLIVPVPLHWRRRWTRGFDQTWLLALHACAEAGLPGPHPLLRRIRSARPQRSLAAEARRRNLDGAFAVPHPARVAGRSIVLVDDVVTTGSTLAAAASALRVAGAAQVIGVAVARATCVPG